MSDYASFSHLTERPVALLPMQPLDDAVSRELMGANLFPNHNTKDDAQMSEMCRAGLLMFNDDLDRAHDTVQAIGSSTGSFWHGIMHRREGDFSNANYWWNRTGAHPLFDELHDVILHRVPDFGFLDELRGEPTWNPRLFNQWCQDSAQSGADEMALREVQRLEMKLLLEWCAAQVKSGK